MSTLKDVATLAGVSTATASLALNGKKQVNDLTRDRVLACARKLNYVPNAVGRNLITGQSRVINLVVINSLRDTNLVTESAFFYHYMEGILEVVGERGYALTFTVVNWEDADMLQYFETKAKNRSVDGLIVIPQYHRPYTFLERLGELPYVILNSSSENREIPTASVDHEYGGRLVAEYCLRNGYRKIGYINGPPDHFDSNLRKKGFMSAIESARGHSIEIRQAQGDWSIRSGYQAAETLFSDWRPDAIFGGDDYMAAGVLRYAYRHGISVPSDLSLIGYDNTTVALSVYPRLTSVDAKLFTVGKDLGRLILSLINGEKTDINVSIRPILTVRESSIPLNQ